MKHTKRVLSLLMALIMVLGLLPLDQLRLIPVAEAAEKSAETVRGSRNITIDYEYGEKYGVTDAKGALTHMADENNQFDIPNPNHDEYWQTEYDSFQWKHVTATWTVWEPKKDTLRKYLQSTDPEDKYICLMRSDVDEYYTKSYMWQPMVISSDKVLDLNGQTLNIRYDANKTNTGSHQTPNLDYHYLWAFEITNGATLTIIDSSVWRGEGSGLGTGAIRFTGYMMNPYYTQIFTYTTRDLFHVDNGNLVIYGGTFQAGRKKDNSDDKVTWDDISTVIGSAVELGVSVASYATGLNTAVAGYKDLLQDQADQAALKAKKLAEEQDNLSPGAETMTPKDGTNQNPAQDTKKTGAEKEDVPTTVEEKKTKKDGDVDKGKPGTKEGENKKDDQKPAKNDANTKLADEQNKIVNKAMNKDAIMGMVNSAFGLVNNIVSMFSTDVKSRISNCINGTVVKVGSNSTFVAYGGNFDGYGSTPNVRNAVVEVVKLTGAGPMPFDHTKTKGGLAYIYGGTFNAYHGANVFNMVSNNEQLQQQWIYTREDGDPAQVNLSKEETGGVQVIYYDNAAALAADTTGTVVPIPVNTANIQVRGGTFRCHYDLVNVATVVKGAEDNFAKFPGTPGSVNLGVESFNENLIKDGRIQIVDTYGDGALVLLDDKTAEKLAWEKEHPGETYPEGLYEYRLFCGDTELRSKAYLTVAPNTAKTNSSHSLQLTYYDNDTGTSFASVYKNDENNTRAAARQTETFFDFPLDRENTVNYDILPLFYSPEHTEKVNNQDTTIPQNMLEYDVYGQRLATSEVWYYPTPVKASNGDPIPDPAYGDVVTTANYNGKSYNVVSNPSTQTSSTNWYLYLHRDAYEIFYGEIQRTGKVSLHQSTTPAAFRTIGEKLSDQSTKASHKEYHSGIRTNMGYYVYKLYKVDPLTRENLSMDNKYDSDIPLLTVRYGDSTESLRCKLPLIQTQNWILDKNHPERNPYGWQGFQTGEMYRVVLEWEEYMGIGYQGNGVFGQKLPAAKTQASILFRCYNVNEKTLNVEDDYLACDYTPLQLTTPHTIVQTSYDYDLEIPVISAGQSATVQIINGKAGMTDYKERKKVFDVYYQWWECDEKGNLIRMIAGTDNIYEKGVTKWAKTEHSAAGGAWHLSTDGKTYVNTVDPNDPRAYTYIYNDMGEPGVYGLPGTYNASGQLIPDRNKWNYKNLHMYTAETYTKADVSGDGSIELSLENNNVFASNSDSCYIPEALEGKFVRVRAIVMNYDWEAAYDPKQTFLSHVIKIKESDKPLTVDLEIDYEDNLDYAAYNHPVTLKPVASGLGYGEYITDVYYSVETDNGTRTLQFNGLTATSGLNLPTAVFPADFYPSGYNLQMVRAQVLNAKVMVVTNRRNRITELTPISYDLLATDVLLHSGSLWVKKLDDIRSGKEKNGVAIAFDMVPLHSSAGSIYKDAVSTNPAVASLDINGRVVYGGSAGESVISVQSPTGAVRSLTVRVIGSFDHVEITNLFAPVVGETFNYNATVPEHAPYHVESVEWIQGAYLNGSGTTGVITNSNAVAEKCRSYTVRVGIAPNEYMEFFTQKADYVLTAYMDDGSTETKSGTVDTRWGCNGAEDDGVYYFEYVFDYLPSDATGGEIKNIYINYPTEVPEGYSLDRWLEELQIYSDGNDEHIELMNGFRVTFGPDAANIAKTLNTSVSVNDGVDGQDCHAFVKGMANGIFLQPKLEKDEHPESWLADNVNVWVNGEKRVISTTTNTWGTQYQWMIIDLSDTVTVVDGKLPDPRPYVKVKPFDLAVGQAFDVSEVYSSEDQRVTVLVSAPYCESGNLSSYLTWDEENQTVTPKDAIRNSDFVAYIDYTVSYDLDGDGLPDYKTQTYTLSISKNNVYASASAVPSSDRNAAITAYMPDGATVAWQQTITGEGSNWMPLPEIEGCFYASLMKDGVREQYFLTDFGDTMYGKDGTYTATTVYAADLEVHPGADKVFAFIKDAEGENVDIQISLDGVCYTAGSVIGGLQPNTDYRLFYRQGVNGEVYTKLFRTAGTEYGVRVGRIPVTDQYLGVLELDHWHFDPASNTLTLKNLSLADVGSPTDIENLYGLNFTYFGLIYSAGILNVELLGNNTLDRKMPKEATQLYWIYAEGDITFTGTGSLTYTGMDGISYYPVYSNSGSIYLNGTGTQSYTARIGTMFKLGANNTDGKIYYRNGSIDFVSQPFANASTPGQYGVIADSDKWVFDSTKPHTVTIQMAGLDENYVTKTETEFIEQLNQNITAGSSDYVKASVKITPNHAAGVTTEQYQTSEYYISGECGSCKYHPACPTCGAVLTGSYNANGGSHNLETCSAKAPTCIYDGWAEYQRCTKCNYSTFELLPALGHDWEHHDEVEPSCTADGKPGYDVCKRCGQTTELLIPAGQPGGAPAKDGTPVMTVSDAYDASILIWKAKGHSLKHVAAQAPTCTASGAADYYQCVECGKKFSDVDGGQELTAAELKLPANGHSWGTWEITTEPTADAEGVKTRVCAVCGAAETAAVPSSEARTFSDVSRDAYYFSAVENMFELGVTTGTSPTTFSPNRTCTRAQAMTFIWRLMGSPAPESAVNPFTDVQANSYYYDAVRWAVANNISSGTTATTFSPNKPCTRAQVVTFLWTASGRPAPKSADNPFTDVAADAYYHDAVLWAMELGITAGTSPSTFSPSKACTRAHIVTFLDRTPIQQGDLEVGEQPVGGELDQAANDPCLILSAEPEGGLYPYTYEWYVSDGTRAAPTKLEGAGGSSVAAFEPGQYYCVITDANGDTVITNTVTVSAKQYPAITAVTQPVGGVSTPDAPYTLRFEVTGGAGVLHYHWYCNGEEIDVTSTPELTVDCKPGNYKCEVTDRLGQTCTSDTVYISFGGANRVNLMEEDEFLMYLEDVFNLSSLGQVLICGKILRGSLSVGDNITVWHYNSDAGTVSPVNCMVLRIEVNFKAVQTATVGQGVRVAVDNGDKNNFQTKDAVTRAGSNVFACTGRIIGDIYVYTKAEGGRHTPFTAGYRPTAYDAAQNVNLGVAAFNSIGAFASEGANPSTEMCFPGYRYSGVEIELTYPSVLYVGQEITFIDGTYTVARMTVTDIQPTTVEINETNFPDDKVREYVSARDIDEDGFLSSEELEGTTDFDFSGTEVADIRGVELFYNLVDLTAENTKLTYADLRGNRKLRYADFVYSPLLTELRTEGLTELKTLEVYESNLQKLDLSDSTKLESLDCSGNLLLKTLSLNSASLSQLSCYGTNLTALDLSGCPLMLETYRNGERTVFGRTAEYTYTIDGVDCTLSIDKNVEVLPEAYPGVPDWVEINDSNFPDAKLRQYISDYFDQAVNGSKDGYLSPKELSEAEYLFDEYDPDFTNLKGIEMLPALNDLDVGYCGIITADLRSNPMMARVYLEGNPLTALYTDGLSEIDYLHVGETQLNALNVTAHKKLQCLKCGGTSTLTELKMGSLPLLEELECQQTSITALDVTGCPNLTKLICSQTGISTLDVTNCPDLNWLWCQNTSISTLDISNCPALLDAYRNGTVTQDSTTIRYLTDSSDLVVNKNVTIITGD